MAGFLGWTPRDTAQQIQDLARRTLAVTLSKYALVALALLLVGAVFVIPALQDDTGAARLVFSNIQEGEAGKPVMVNPRYQGVDARKQPYVISAKTAEQRRDGLIQLQSIQADITLLNGSWISFQAAQGIYNADLHTLDLSGGVQAFYDKGYELRTDTLSLDLEHALATGKSPVEAQGPLGTLQAEGLRIDQSKKYLQFTPKVKVVLLTKGTKE